MIDIHMSMTCTNKVIDEHAIGTQAIQCTTCLDHLNWVRLMLTPNKDSSIEVNQRVAMSQIKEYAHEYDLQETFIFMKMLEGMAAQVSLIYNQSLVKAKVADPSELAKRSNDWQNAYREQKERNMKPATRKTLKGRDLAIANLMKIGLSRSDAEKSVDAGLEAQGKLSGGMYKS